MDEHVTAGQAIIIVTASRLALAVSIMPIVNLPPYNQDVWISTLLSFIYTIIMMLPLLFLSNRFNNFNLTGYIRLIYGKTMGSIIMVLYGLYFLANSFNGVTILTELLTSTVLVQEYNLNIVVFVIIVTFYFITKGIVSIARSLQLLAPIAIFIIVALMILGINNVNFDYMRPILRDSSFFDINAGAFLISLHFSDIFLLLMIVPDLKDKNSISRIFIISTLITIISLAIFTIFVQGAIGIQQTKHSNVSFLLYVRLINALDLFERIDSIFVASWIITSIARNAGFLYIATRVFRELFNKKEDDRIVLSITSIVLGVASFYILNYRSVIGIRRYFDLLYNILFIVFAVVIPVITCLVYLFRRKTLKQRESSQKPVDKLE